MYADVWPTNQESQEKSQGKNMGSLHCFTAAKLKHLNLFLIRDSNHWIFMESIDPLFYWLGYAADAQPLKCRQFWGECGLGNISYLHLFTELWWRQCVPNRVSMETRLRWHRDVNYCPGKLTRIWNVTYLTLSVWELMN